MTFDDMWKSLEERDTTGKYKQAREMAELNVEQLEFAYNSGFADAKSKYERPHGKWLIDCPPQYADGAECSLCQCNFFGALSFNYCPNCGAEMKGGDE